MKGQNSSELELKEMLELNEKYQVDRENLSKSQRELLYDYMNRRGAKRNKK